MKVSEVLSDDQPRPAIAPVYARLGDQPDLFAGGTVERINVPAFVLMPEVVIDEDFHPYLPLNHKGIIT